MILRVCLPHCRSRRAAAYWCHGQPLHFSNTSPHSPNEVSLLWVTSALSIVMHRSNVRAHSCYAREVMQHPSADCWLFRSVYNNNPMITTSRLSLYVRFPLVLASVLAACCSVVTSVSNPRRCWHPSLRHVLASWLEFVVRDLSENTMVMNC